MTVRKVGYETATTTGLRDVYRLTRILLDSEAAVCELASDYKGRDVEIFRQEARLRPILMQLAEDRRFAESARDLLALIPEPSDLRLLLQLPPPPQASSDGWHYALASSLIALHKDKAAQAFLRRCAQEHPWIKAGANLTLKLQREHLTGPNLEPLAERAALAMAPGKWQKNGSPQFNRAQDKALIEMTFDAGSDRIIYLATFHKIGLQWSLRAARIALQMRMVPLPPPPFKP